MTKITKIEHTKSTEDRKIRVAAYCRVSTNMDDQLESLAAQKVHYNQVIRQNPNWVFAGIYYDEGITGTKKDVRPELLRLLDDCKAGKIDLVLTKSISRFSRNTTDCLEMVRTLSAHRVGIFFERENINTQTMDDEFLLSILGSLAESESLSISENEKWSIRKRFLKGTYRQGMAPYGYSIADGKLVIDEETAPVVRFIFNEVCAGKGSSIIAKELNARGASPMISNRWSPVSINAILRNERYVGDVLYQKTFSDSNYNRHLNNGDCDQFLHRDHHEAIISREQFAQAQAILEQHRLEKGIDSEACDYRKRYLFTGILVCSECGSRLKRVVRKEKNKEDRIYWACKKHKKDINGCPLKDIPEEHIKAAFTTVINKLIFSRKELMEPFVKAFQNSSHTDATEQIEEINQKLNDLSVKSQALNALATSNLLDPAILKKAQSDLAVSRAELNSRKESLTTRTKTVDKGLSEGAKLLRNIREKDISDIFDENLFQMFIRTVHVYSRQEYGFEFTCGLIFREVVILK